METAKIINHKYRTWVFRGAYHEHVEKKQNSFSLALFGEDPDFLYSTWIRKAEICCQYVIVSAIYLLNHDFLCKSYWRIVCKRKS
jgi:hypothetical protein